MDSVNKTKRFYFNTEIMNQTNEPVLAKYETALLKPLLLHPEDWDLSINRFRLPLSGIPLTTKNIPFQQWQVSLGYYTGSNWVYASDYVPQLNPAFYQKPINYNMIVANSATTQSTVYNVSTDTITHVNSSFNISNINFETDIFAFDSSGTGTIYSVSATNTVNIYNAQNGSLNTPLNLFGTIGQCFCIAVDPNTRHLYTLVSDTSSGNLFIQVYTNSGSTWAYSTSTPIGATWPSTPTYFMGLANGWIYFMDGNNNNNNVIKYFEATNLNNSGEYNLGQLCYELVCINNTYVCVCANFSGNVLVLDTNPTSGSLTPLRSIPYNFSDGASALVIGQDYSGNLLYYSFEDFIVYAINLSTGSVAYQTTQFSSGYPIYPALLFPAINGTYPIDAGPADIYDYQTFLNQINNALTTAFASISTQTGYQSTDAPRIIFDASTKLFSVIVDGYYLQSSKYVLDLNQNLLNLFNFPSVLDSNNSGFFSIIVENNVNNTWGTTTPPTYVQVQQESSTLQKFYDLVRILVQTSQIPVSGDSEGTNNSILLITDVVPDTSTLDPTSLLVYQPTVLRWYNLYATQPLAKIDLYFSYGTKDGTIYPVYIAAGEYASCKLEFKSVK